MKGRDLIWDVFFFFFFSGFPSWLLNCCNLKHVLAKCTYFTRPSTSSASFSTSPACPAKIHHQQIGFPHLMVKVRMRAGLGGLGGGGTPPPHDDRKSDDSIRGKKSGGMMIEKSDDSMGKKYLKKKQLGGHQCLCAKASW